MTGYEKSFLLCSRDDMYIDIGRKIMYLDSRCNNLFEHVFHFLLLSKIPYILTYVRTLAGQLNSVDLRVYYVVERAFKLT